MDLTGGMRDMGRVISDRFKDAVKHSRLTYEDIAKMTGVGSKCAISYTLNKKEDKDWAYADIVQWCKILDIGVKGLLEDVDRKKGNNMVDDSI